MLSQAEIKSLRQVNVSVDADKTSKRLKEDFSSASNEEKSAVVELSGQKRSSFYRAYEKGSVNARLVLAMSQILNVSPFYYTGESDERLPFDESALVSFLEKHNYDELAQRTGEAEKPAPKRRYTRRQKPAPEPAESTAPADEPVEQDAPESDEMIIQLSLSDTPEMQKAVDKLEEEDAVLLLRALYRRERAGGDAGLIAALVKRCLLS